MATNDLAAVLARYPALARPLERPEPLGNAGGLSGARLWRFASGCGTLVARAWPPDGPDRAALEQVHRWLGAASAVGFVPVPLAGRDGRTVQEQGGRLWEVAPWLKGSAEPCRPPARARLRAGFAALAAFHQALGADATRGPSPGLRARLRELDGLAHGGFEILQHALERAPTESCAAPARRWLTLARRIAPRLADPMRRASGLEVRLQPCLRDARPEHWLFEGDRVTGLVDFGAMGVECVAADLARLLAEWIGPDRPARAEALDAYATVRPLNETETGLIAVFESTAALLGAGHWIRWHLIERRTFDDPEAVVRGIERGLAHLSRLAADPAPGT